MEYLVSGLRLKVVKTYGNAITDEILKWRINNTGLDHAALQQKEMKAHICPIVINEFRYCLARTVLIDLTFYEHSSLPFVPILAFTFGVCPILKSPIQERDKLLPTVDRNNNNCCCGHVQKLCQFCRFRPYRVGRYPVKTSILKARSDRPRKTQWDRQFSNSPRFLHA